MLRVYTSVLRIALLFAKFISVFSGKVRQFFDVRKSQDFQVDSNGRKVICFHCSSLGEYQMIIPLISDPVVHEQYFVAITFFSPSGFRHAQTEGLADAKFYLPMDLPAKTEAFLDQLKPDLFVFVKYDFWFNLISELQKRKIEIWLVNGLFRPNQSLLRWYMKPFLKMIFGFDYLFLQNEKSLKILKKHGLPNDIKVLVNGDLRDDRVYDLCMNAEKLERIERWKNGGKVMIMGSSWPAEELMFKRIYQELPDDFKILIAPHDVSLKHIKEIRQMFSSATINLWSEPENADSEILILDTIGVLGSAYQYGEFAFIGGAFGKGLHNILEATTFGLPVICGPNISKFPEAGEFQQLGFLFVVRDEQELEFRITELLFDSVRKPLSELAKTTMLSRRGAKDEILKNLHSFTGRRMPA